MKTSNPPPADRYLLRWGIEGPIRGYSVRNERPDLALLDDVDDRESARSETQTETRERIIEEDIGGLGGPDKSIARVMLCTLINRTCTAATYTDRRKKPSFRGIRNKLLEKEPENKTLVQQYIKLRQNRAEDDSDARVAHQFYLDNQEAIEAGSECTNPYRYDKRILLDGQPSEVAALQHCLNIIADRGREHFDTEYQNDPRDDSGIVESGITAGRVQRQLSGYPQLFVPSGCTVITQGIDVGTFYLHWVVRAWRPDGTSYFTIDYGTKMVHGAKRRINLGLDVMIRTALKEHMDQMAEKEYMDPAGELLPVDLTLADSRYYIEAVRQACKEIGLGIRPLLGYGKSDGCIKANFSPVQRATRDHKPLPERAFETRDKVIGGHVWTVHADTDYWKRWEHDRWMTEPGKPGSMLLWGEPSADPRTLSPDERDHETYAEQICGEIEVEENVDGTLKRYW